MRRLLPLPCRDGVDVDDAYWVADPGSQHVRGVMVASVDGAAQRDGRSGGLSGSADTTLFALLRGHADVLLVGATTVRVEGYGGEKPSVERRAWRRARGLSEVPPIAVVSRSAVLDSGSALFADTEARPIVIVPGETPAGRRRELARRADVIVAGESDVDLAAALDALAERGLRRVSCEGGPRLLSGIAACGRLDELCLTVSPAVLGGPATRILDGPFLDSPLGLRLVHILEDDGAVFLRYDLTDLSAL
ncbi:MAG: pyrimidine reductase family protein [Solirubrobacteraceae bacterium]